MKKGLILVSLLVAIIFIVGCSNGAETTEQTVETEDGDVKIETTTTGDDWCSPGSNWQTTSTDGSASWVVDELVTSGKYAGYCHVIYTSNADGEEVRMDYWFDESGDNGYVEMEVNGQTIVQEYHE